MTPAILKSIEAQFAFALRNGAGKLTIGGKTVDALLIEAPTFEGNQGRGRHRGEGFASVGCLRSALPNRPTPGTSCKLDGWNCAVADEGVEEGAGVWTINLRSS